MCCTTITVILSVIMYFVQVNAICTSTPPEFSSICYAVPYNHTSHSPSTETLTTLQHYRPLFSSHCSKYVLLFICSAYVPFCSMKAPAHTVLPCRSFCHQVKKDCFKLFVQAALPWPTDLICSRFPTTLCLSPPTPLPSTSTPALYFTTKLHAQPFNSTARLHTATPYKTTASSATTFPPFSRVTLELNTTSTLSKNQIDKYIPIIIISVVTVIVSIILIVLIIFQILRICRQTVNVMNPVPGPSSVVYSVPSE